MALTGVVAAVDQLSAAPDPAAARRGLADTLRLAGEHGLDHVVMQCRALEAAHAAAIGDYRSMTTAGNAALSCAAANGWLRSVWACSAHAMLAYAALLRAEPVDALRHAVQGLRIDGVGIGISPAMCYALGSAHGCSVFDIGRRAAAVRALGNALDLATPLDLVRPFVLTGPAVRAVLRAWTKGPNDAAS
jgi:hypothetical protein